MSLNLNQPETPSPPPRTPSILRIMSPETKSVISLSIEDKMLHEAAAKGNYHGIDKHLQENLPPFPSDKESYEVFN